MKKPDKVILVSDAMRATCLGDGQFELGGQAVTVKEGVARLANGALAGSTLTMPQAVRNMLKFTDCSLTDVIQYACTNPATLLGLGARKGKLAEGMDADFIVLDNEYNVVLTVCGGEVIFQANA
jgi:N-acetylglucosamine-6-phosphate deacetylase